MPVEEKIKDLEEALELLRRNTPPIGSIIFLASEKAPEGYRLCNGDAVSRDNYEDLFKVIDITWGPGDGSTTFNLPNLLGFFPRFWDPSRTLGQAEDDTTRMPRDGSFKVSWNDHDHDGKTSEDGSHIHKMAEQPSHAHNFQPVGNHDHIYLSGFDRLLKRTNQSTIAYGDSILAGGVEEPDLNDSRPLKADGAHNHNFSDDGKHSHDIYGPEPATTHHHTIISTGHDHIITTRGDDETRPKNQALVGFIKTGK